MRPVREPHAFFSARQLREADATTFESAFQAAAADAIGSGVAS